MQDFMCQSNFFYLFFVQALIKTLKQAQDCNISTFKDYLPRHLLSNYFSEEQKEGGALIGGGVMNGKSMVTTIHRIQLE